METSCKKLVKENRDWKDDNDSSNRLAQRCGGLGVGKGDNESMEDEPLAITEMPDSIFLHIFSYLPFSSIGSVAQVCQRWSRVACDELLWKGTFLRHYKVPRGTKYPAKSNSWRSEFKRLYYHTPCLLSEERKEHRDEVLHISFSHDGTMFATCSKDGFFKVWECGQPCRLLFEKDMMSSFSWKFTQFSQFNESDTCLLVSGVYFGSMSTSGEIAVFNLLDNFSMQCRVTNKPYDVFGAWYDNDHLLSGTLYFTNGGFRSVSAIWLSKASQEVESEMESVSMVLYRFENRNSSSIRLLHVAEVERSDDDFNEHDTSNRQLHDQDPQPSTEQGESSQLLSVLDLMKTGKEDSSLSSGREEDVVVGEASQATGCDTSLLDRLLTKNIAENEFDLENEDDTDTETDGENSERSTEVLKAHCSHSSNNDDQTMSTEVWKADCSHSSNNDDQIMSTENDYFSGAVAQLHSTFGDGSQNVSKCDAKIWKDVVSDVLIDDSIGVGFNVSCYGESQQPVPSSSETADPQFLSGHCSREGVESCFSSSGSSSSNSSSSSSNSSSSFTKELSGGFHALHCPMEDETETDSHQIQPVSSMRCFAFPLKDSSSTGKDSCDKCGEKRNASVLGDGSSSSSSSSSSSRSRSGLLLIDNCDAKRQDTSDSSSGCSSRKGNDHLHSSFNCNVNHPAMNESGVEFGNNCDIPVHETIADIDDDINGDILNNPAIHGANTNRNSNDIASISNQHTDDCHSDELSFCNDDASSPDHDVGVAGSSGVDCDLETALLSPCSNSKMMDNAATQTEVSSTSRESLFQSSVARMSHPLSHSSSLQREAAPRRATEKLLIYTWGSETYIPHKIGIKRMKRSDFCKGEVKTRQSSMLLPDVLENLHNVGEDKRDSADISIEMNGHIVGLSLSPDNRYLYVNCRSWPPNYIIVDPQQCPPLAQQVEISTIDLRTFQFVGPVLRSHMAYTHSDECFFLNLDVSEDYVVSGAEDRKGYIWDRHYGVCLGTFQHRNVVNSMSVCPTDQEVAISVSDDHTFKVWMSRHKIKEAEKLKNSAKSTDESEKL